MRKICRYFFFFAFLPFFLVFFFAAFLAVFFFVALGPMPTQPSTVSTASLILLFFFAIYHSLNGGKAALYRSQNVASTLSDRLGWPTIQTHQLDAAAGS